ncbi:integrase [Pandoraea thiooxydans]|uniref:Uncharacterized protein n=1 Tax=Pandoraea thiooxydans TaxID=445709 RepID=A0A0U4EFB7_9BURK|nr:hypothetical protein [Pandoraea thiooxydans]ALX34897.1 hypothetical protein ABW99_09120 [Pandoraea thiooxydans]APR95691.1 integrase [Pandoraea thiooxydans]
MHHYRQVLVRIRHGDSDRELARCRYMGRRKLAALRELAEQRGWLKPDAPLPDDSEIAAALGSPRKGLVPTRFYWRLYAGNTRLLYAGR